MTTAGRFLFVITVATTAIVFTLPAGGRLWGQARSAATPQRQESSSASPGQPQFDEGVRLLGERDFPAAIESFQAAVAQDPNSATFHIGLSHAFAAAKQPVDAWRELRKAVELDDQNSQLGAALVASWQAFGVQGLFNVGRPAEAIAQALGKADKVERHADHERWIYGFMALNFADGKLDSVMDLRGLNRELLRETDRLTIQTDGRQWRPGHRLVSMVHTTTEYVLPEQQVQNWKELVTVERLMGLVDRKVEPKQLMNSIRQRIQDMDSNAEWKVIAETDDDIIYLWSFSKDGERPPHHELARLVEGQRDIYRIAFATKEAELMQARQEQWIDLLKTAKVVALTDSRGTTIDDPDTEAVRSNLDDSSSPEVIAWDMGSYLGLATALYHANADASATKKVMERAQMLAEGIGEELPEFPAASGNRAVDQGTLLRFAIKKAGSPYARTIRDRYGEKPMRLFEMGLKANLLLLIYQPGQDSVNSIADTIETSAEANDIPRDVWGDLVDAIRAKASFADIKRHVIALNRDVRGHFAESPE